MTVKEEGTRLTALKPSMRKGWNGNFEAGYGNDDHYRAKGMANRFKNKMNLSINGTANDNGINSNQRIGANYSQNTQKLKYGGSIEVREINAIHGASVIQNLFCQTTLLSFPCRTTNPMERQVLFPLIFVSNGN